MTNEQRIFANVGALLVALLGALCAPPAQARDDRQYRVEVVVFRHTAPASAGEMWGRPVALPVEENASGDRGPATGELPDEEEIPLNAETIRAGRFERLAAADYKMADAVAKLSKASRFSPLLHTGWVQPGRSLEESTAKIVSGHDSTSSVTGRVVFSRGRYLHLDFDLTLATKDGEYRLRQSHRRIRTDRFHYIDHPLFSAIAVITPVPVQTTN